MCLRWDKTNRKPSIWETSQRTLFTPGRSNQRENRRCCSARTIAPPATRSRMVDRRIPKNRQIRGEWELLGKILGLASSLAHLSRKVFHLAHVANVEQQTRDDIHQQRIEEEKKPPLSGITSLSSPHSLTLHCRATVWSGGMVHHRQRPQRFDGRVVVRHGIGGQPTHCYGNRARYSSSC